MLRYPILVAADLAVFNWQGAAAASLPDALLEPPAHEPSSPEAAWDAAMDTQIAAHDPDEPWTLAKAGAAIAAAVEAASPVQPVHLPLKDALFQPISQAEAPVGDFLFATVIPC
jgi:hypothetical protein